jgi:hypothetical protein
MNVVYLSDDEYNAIVNERKAKSTMTAERDRQE